MLSKNAIARERQIADSFAGGGENRVAKRGDKRRHSRLSHTGGRRGALHKVDMGVNRNFVDSGDGIVVEIRLLDCTGVPRCMEVIGEQNPARFSVWISRKTRSLCPGDRISTPASKD